VTKTGCNYEVSAVKPGVESQTWKRNTFSGLFWLNFLLQQHLCGWPAGNNRTHSSNTLRVPQCFLVDTELETLRAQRWSGHT